MMNTSYTKLFNFRISHSYFSKDCGKIFSISPTIDCVRELRRFKLLFKATDNGFVILYPFTINKKNSFKPVCPIDEKVKLSFVFFSGDEYLLNYSDLPFYSPGKYIYYFNNLKKQSGQDRINMSKSKYVSRDDCIYLQPIAFKEFFESAPGESFASGPVDCDISDIYGDSLLLKKIYAKEGRVECNLNLQNLGNGFYVLKLNNVEKRKFYIDNDLYKRRPFAVAEIFIDEQFLPNLTGNENPGEKVNSNNMSFQLNIARRSTIWRYKLITRSCEDLKGAKLRIEHKEQKFIPAYAEIKAGNTPVVFRSGDRIPLSTTPLKNIELQINRNGEGFTPLIPHLPNPGPGSMEISNENSEDVCSDVFIYI